MKKKIFIAFVLGMIVAGCGEPSPNMNSKDLREDANKAQKQEEAKKVDSKLDDAKEVNKGPIEPEMVADNTIENTGEQNQNVAFEMPVVHFAFDKYDVQSEDMKKLETFAQKLKDDNLMDKTLAIGGHCDEWGADEYNIALGLKRAKATEDALKSLGVTAQMKLTSYGESQPVCMAHEKKCWQLNRRAEISILP